MTRFKRRKRYGLMTHGPFLPFDRGQRNEQRPARHDCVAGGAAAARVGPRRRTLNTVSVYWLKGLRHGKLMPVLQTNAYPAWSCIHS
jgi:hypothetical protein